MIDPELTYDPDIPVGALLAFMVDKWRLHIPLDTTWRAFLIEHRSDLNIRVDQDMLKLQKSKAGLIGLRIRNFFGPQSRLFKELIQKSRKDSYFDFYFTI